MRISFNRKKNKFIKFTQQSQKITFNSNHPNLVNKFRSKRVLTVYLFSDKEYIYRFSGRCTSYRSRGKISSVLMRNTAYGVEQRIFFHNPRANVYF